MLQLLTEPNAIPLTEACAAEAHFPGPSKVANVAEPPRGVRVLISSPVGFQVSGELKSVSRAGILVLTPVAVPIRCPLEITITGCRMFRAEAFYCLARPDGHQVGLVFAALQKPNLVLGAVTTIEQLTGLDPRARGSVVDVGRSSVSLLCKTSLVTGTEVRLESAGWVFFGTVRTVLATSMVTKCMEIHLHAAFQAAGDEAPDTQ